jgi:hypothetical protein
MELVHPDSNRIGRFNLMYETMADDRELTGALLALCVVLHVDDHESGRGKTYYAASPLFQPLAEGEEIPEYRIESVFDGRFADPEREAGRVDSGRFGFAAVRKIIIRVPTVGVATVVH